jgi:DNA-binding NarL/FixJ family response regulator
LSIHEEPSAVEKVMAAGAEGLVLKRTAATDLVPAVRAVLRGPKGNVETYKVQDPKNLENVKVGDQVVITYTVAVAISVEEVKE